MPAQYEMEELADMAIQELREFIDTENQFVAQRHNLHSKLLSWDYVIAHLDERIPRNMTHLHALNRQIAQKLIEIRDLIESGSLHELRIIKEEKRIRIHLEEKVKHHDWRAVKTDLDLETREQGKVLRLEKQELMDLHSRFIDIMRLMKRSELVSAIEKDLTVQHEKEGFVKLEEYYFLQIYNFLRAYERIFRNLWVKELIVAKKIAGRI